jgi:CheY-like chemotaxis protein
MPAILVVDDDRDTCRNLADLFGDLGYAIDTAEGGDIALEKARQRQYDLGLLDLRMPDMDGLTLCRHLKQLQPRMVAMIVTAYAGSGLDEEARAAGARHVLPKPVDFPRLLALVGEALAQPNQAASGVESVSLAGRHRTRNSRRSEPTTAFNGTTIRGGLAPAALVVSEMDRREEREAEGGDIVVHSHSTVLNADAGEAGRYATSHELRKAGFSVLEEVPWPEQAFNGFLEAAPDAVVIADRDGRIIRVNAQAERLFGYSRGELLGREVEMLIPERFRGRHVGQRTAYVANCPVLTVKLHQPQAPPSEGPAPVTAGRGEAATAR